MGRAKKRAQPPAEVTPEVRASQGRERAAALTVAAFFAVAIVVGGLVLGGMLIRSAAGGRSDDPGSAVVAERSGDGPRKAAIVDQLGLRFPSPDFVGSATRRLEEDGYVVDYYPGEQVTVDFYRQLPARGYELIILRAHATRTQGIFQSRGVDTVQLFTSEPFDLDRYADERDEGMVGFVAEYSSEDLYFGVTSDFVASRMEGKFDDTTVVIMGCEGLSIETLAQAFVRNGAKAVIGWDGLVSASHTDAATDRLLEHLVTDGLPAEDAVARTMAEMGPDPSYDSVLLSYSGGR